MSKKEDYNPLFDFNNDGKNDAAEKGAKYQFYSQMTEGQMQHDNKACGEIPSSSNGTANAFLSIMFTIVGIIGFILIEYAAISSMGLSGIMVGPLVIFGGIAFLSWLYK